MISETLINLDASHQVSVNRYGATIANSVVPFLNEAKEDVETLLLKEGGTIRSRARLSKLLIAINKALSDYYGGYIESATESLNSLIEPELAFNAKSMNSITVDYDSSIPAATQVLEAATAAPMQLETGAVSFPDAFSDWKSTEIKRANKIITLGFFQGQTTQQISSTLKNTIGGLTRRNAQTIARTATNHMSNQAKVAFYKDNDDLVTGYQWVSTLDSKTSSVCRSRDGNVYEFGKGPLPPAHPNCLTGDTLISTCGAVSNAYKRAYKGTIVDIRTKSGRHITITPNHPILTARGWVAAGEINCVDKLFSVRGVKSLEKHQKDNVVAKFSDLFSAINVSSDPRFISDTPLSPEDFHGDVSDGKVSVIFVDSLAWSKVKSKLTKKRVHFKLAIRKFIDLTLSCVSSVYKLLPANKCSTNSIMRTFCKSRDLFWGSSIHSGLLLLRSVSGNSTLAFKESFYRILTTLKSKVLWDSTSPNSRVVSIKNALYFTAGKINCLSKANFNPAFLEDSGDWAFTAAENLPDLFNSKHIDSVELDDVVDVTFREIDTHVYNLENKNHWYIANGIITHNCRSSTAATLDGRFDFLKKGATRSSSDGYVSSTTTYYSWLKNQPAAAQDSVLGKTKGLIFRNAGLTTDEFKSVLTNRMGRELTIEQMIAKDDRIREYLEG